MSGDRGAEGTTESDIRRRLSYLMLFRVVVISLVLGVTSVLYWLSDGDVGSPAAVAIYGIITGTYVLSVLYALAIRRGRRLEWLCDTQLTVDLFIAALLVHLTGGAQSAYTFFFPLAILGAAVVRQRRGVVVFAPAAVLVFLAVVTLGWTEIIPVPQGSQIDPAELSAVGFARAIVLNLFGTVIFGLLALKLAGELERTSATLEDQRSATADLLSLHKDIIRSLTSGLVTVDESDHVITFNRSACEILRTPAREIDGAHLRDLFPSMVSTLAEVGPLGCIPRGELSFGSAGSVRAVGYSVSPLFNHRNESLGRVIHFQDLTEMKTMEASIKRGERLAVIGKLAAGVAHEIRNPLASISGSIELLGRSHSPQDPDSAALMNIVTREVDRLDGMISELLDYANPQPLKKVNVDLRELVRDTLRVFRSDPRFQTIALSDNLEERSSWPKVNADAEKLRQVIWNLVRNAAEATNSGGAVSVSLKADTDSMVLTVEDDGPGISKEVQEHVFDPFFTTKSRGTGLGLATVHTIVSDHGGIIFVDSEQGNGSVFTVELPRLDS